MDNSTSAPFDGWEYYYDYVDPVIVDQSKLKYNKYSIVIAFWITLAAFVGVLFLTLNLMSGSGHLPWRCRRRSRRRNTSSSLI
ncbi:melanocortin-2 receptor accessory protein [Syngnathus scovelli]|uniref:melanocortin-2 receptor accessory protein n=1 Tax=Syngnathus scovelli TaxID=161590 RepID=UPI0035CB6720